MIFSSLLDKVVISVILGLIYLIFRELESRIFRYSLGDIMFNIYTKTRYSNHWKLHTQIRGAEEAMDYAMDYAEKNPSCFIRLMEDISIQPN